LNIILKLSGLLGPLKSIYFLAVVPAALSLFAPGAAGLLVPVLKVSGTLLPAAETLRYPCISWCKAEQKSVQ
jgi:hypothetical protein